LRSTLLPTYINTTKTNTIYTPYPNPAPIIRDEDGKSPNTSPSPRVGDKNSRAIPRFIATRGRITFDGI